MGCVPSTRVSSSVPRAESVIVKDTGSAPTTPVLTTPKGGDEDKASADGCVDGSEERKEDTGQPFQRTPTPRPQTGQLPQSPDSGVYELDEEYADVVTELSAPEKVRAVELDFEPREDIELVVEGKQCPRRMSGKDRERHEQEVILDKLRNEGLVLRPESKASGGLAFELVSAESENKTSKGGVRKLPPLLQKRKKKNNEKRDQHCVTEESIRDKLEKAECRRKKQVEEKVRKAKSFIEEANNAKKQDESGTSTKHVVKMASKAESREKRLQEMVLKLREKDQHAERVRRRKLLRQATIRDSTELPT